MAAHIHTTNPRQARRLWEDLGGTVTKVRRTGEERWTHPEYPSTIRANCRRNDVPAAIICRINQILAASKGT